MSEITWSKIQKQRITELNGEQSIVDMTFTDTKTRDKEYQKIEKGLVADNKKNLLNLQHQELRPLLPRLESKIIERLNQEGFVQVVTPHIITKDMLDKMTVTSDHPLSEQVFWVDPKKCLRPMLAPNLYILMKELDRSWDKPMKFFEIGTCFRKESQGANHLNEFTMLNLVEVGGDLEGRQVDRLKELAQVVMEGAGVDNYHLETVESEVYNETVDVMIGDLEVGSGAFGPHDLDNNWGIFDPWVGIGFGLERLVTVAKGYQNIRRVGRSITYLNGSRLNI